MRITDRLVGIRLVLSRTEDTYRIDHIYKRSVNNIDVEIAIQKGLTMEKHLSAASLKETVENLYLSQLGDIWEKNTPKDMMWLFILDSGLTRDEFAQPGDLWILYAQR